MTEYIERFKIWLAESRNLSASSVEYYCADALSYYDFVLSSGLPYESAATAFLANLKEKGLSDKTLARYISSLRVFFDFLIGCGAATRNPFSEIKLPKFTKKEPEFLSVTQVQAILSKPDTSTFDGLRDKIVLELLYQSGLKLSDILSLNTDNVNFQHNIITLKTNGRERIVPFFPPLNAALQEYFSNVRPMILKGKIERALLLNMRGGRLTRQAVWQIVEKYAKMSGIEQKISPKVLRQSLAAHMIDDNADLKDIKEVMGLSSSAAGSLYGTIAKIKLEKALNTAAAVNENIQN